MQKHYSVILKKRLCNIIAQVILMEEDKEIEMIRKRKLDAMQAAPKEPSVIVYSTSSCPYCTLAKNYLSEKKIKFTEYDVGRDQARAREMVMKTNQTGVPVIEINGRMVVGFDRARIDSLLAKPAPPQRNEALGNLFFDPFNI